MNYLLAYSKIYTESKNRQKYKKCKILIQYKNEIFITIQKIFPMQKQTILKNECWKYWILKTYDNTEMIDSKQNT